VNHCDVCNGERNLVEACPECDDGTLLEDMGPVDNYYGPYSPYEEYSGEVTSDESCMHLCRCPECNSEVTIPIH